MICFNTLIKIIIPKDASEAISERFFVIGFITHDFFSEKPRS